MLDFIVEKESVWELLKRTRKPIVLYGMGNGADKILDWCEANGVVVQGIFASDEFVRHQQFRGMCVESYAEVRARLGSELLIVLAFASERPEVLARFQELAAEQEVVAPHLPLFEEEATVSSAWLTQHAAALMEVYERLADDWSRKVFAATLNYKLSGKIQYLFDCETQREDDLRTLLQLGQQESYVDLGAYNGDTIEEFGRLTDFKWRHVIAVEPDRRNCRKLRAKAEEFEQRGLSVEVVESGIWDSVGELAFSDSGGRQSTFVGAEKKIVPVTTIDSIVGGTEVSYIKMDVEGAEQEALAGGMRSVQLFKPQLFIAAYHYDVDLFRLPQQIWSMEPQYKIYLRKHPYVPAWELNFICVVGK